MSKVYFFVGPAGCGKSTARQTVFPDARVYDFYVFIKPHLDRQGHLETEQRKELQAKWIEEFKDTEVDVVEFAQGKHLPGLLQKTTKHAVVLYLHAPKDVCQERMEKRGRGVPKEYHATHFLYDRTFYEHLQEEFDFSLIDIETTCSPEEVISQLEAKLVHNPS